MCKTKTDISLNGGDKLQWAKKSIGIAKGAHPYFKKIPAIKNVKFVQKTRKIVSLFEIVHQTRTLPHPVF